MKLNSLLLAAAIATAAVSSPVIARGPSSPAYERWEQRLRARVDALHVYPRAAPVGAMGDVLVSFRIGSDGRPTDPSIVESSGYAIFDSAAVRLVSGIGRVGPIPAGEKRIERVTIKLSYGEPQRLAESMRVNKSDAEERAANERRNRWIVSSESRMAQRP